MNLNSTGYSAHGRCGGLPRKGKFPRQNRESIRYSDRQATRLITVDANCSIHELAVALSDPMSDLVRRYDFPVPDAFLDL
jgi:hypothetical protein